MLGGYSYTLITNTRRSGKSILPFLLVKIKEEIQMEKDMMQILRKVPLHIDDEIARCIWRQIDGTNIGEMILVAVEYGRILGKREERARRKNLA